MFREDTLWKLRSKDIDPGELFYVFLAALESWSVLLEVAQIPKNALV